MRFVPRLSLPMKFAALAVMGAFLAVEPLLDARSDLAPAGAYGAACREDHNPIVDRLLPEGTGGTVLYDDLGDYAGLAFQGAGRIALATNAATSFSAEVELHERAHLLEFAQPAVVARLMRGQPAPARGQYAATSAVEHFAEMAAQAWKVTSLLMPVDFCVEDSPATLLRQAETDVPGTAGFVVWYLRDPVVAAAEGADALRAEATRLTANRLPDWEALYAALRERQLADGGFTLWPEYSVREYLERRRAHVRLAGGFTGRIEAAQITASLTLLDLAGR